MPTLRQKKAVLKTGENGGIVSQAMIAAGYSPATAKNPEKLTKSKGWIELMEQHFPDKMLAQKHKELLNSTGLDHMVFPVGPENDKERERMINSDIDKAAKAGKIYEPIDYLSDIDIRELLASVNCTVRRIVHGEQARHVYFWSSDNKARKDGLDMAYKLKGSYAPEKTVNLNVEVAVDENDLSLAKNLLDQRRGSKTSSAPSDGVIPEPMGGEVQN